MEEIALIVGAILIRWMSSGTLARLLDATLFKRKAAA